MLKTQKQYLDYLDRQGAMLEGSLAQYATSAALRESVQAAEMLVPVIGSFSAGKSSLINALIGRELLPVGITPETELATELRHSESERIEVVTRDGQILTFGIDELASLKSRAAEFSHLRVWLHSEALGQLAPLVIVDMPGIDSTLASHNKAIGNYIERGTHYLVVVSVEAGGLTRSMERHLTDIRELGRDFSLILSKCNLRADSEVDDVAQMLEAQTEDALGIRYGVRKIGLDGAAQLKSAFDAIDPECVFANLYGDEVKHTYFSATESINATLAALKTSSADNTQAIDEMAAHLKKIERKREDLIADIEARYSASAVRGCVDAVGRALEQGIHELVEAGMSSNRESLSRAVMEIVRSTLIRKTKSMITEISQKIVADFSVQLDDLNALMSSYMDGDDWASRVTANASQLLEQANSGLGRLGEVLRDKDSAKKIYRVATTIVAVMSNVVVPALELIIIFLPDLLAPFFEARQREALDRKIRTEMIPGIKSSLGEKLPEIFAEQIASVIAQVSTQFESAIVEKKAAIERLEHERKEHQVNVDEQVTALRDLQQRLNALANQLLFDGEAA